MFLNDWKGCGIEKVAEDFGVDPATLDGIEILVASYSYKDYSGMGYVLFVKDGKFYEVHGSHCSCYGLEEGGWEPEECTLEELRVLIEKRDDWEFEGEYTKELVLERLEHYLAGQIDPAVPYKIKF